MCLILCRNQGYKFLPKILMYCLNINPTNFWDKPNKYLYLQLQDNENPFLSLKLSFLSLPPLMLIYSTAFARSETPPGFKPGILEGLREGVLLLPMDTSHLQVNRPASSASQPFWKASIRVHLPKPCRGQRKQPSGFSLPSLHTSPWAPTVPAPQHPQENHLWPALLSHHMHLPKETSPAPTTITSISSPETLLPLCLHQHIIQYWGILPGFMAIQTFNQMMQNIDKIWVPQQCKCITPILRGLHTVGLPTF